MVWRISEMSKWNDTKGKSPCKFQSLHNFKWRKWQKASLLSLHCSTNLEAAAAGGGQLSLAAQPGRWKPLAAGDPAGHATVPSHPPRRRSRRTQPRPAPGFCWRPQRRSSGHFHQPSPPLWTGRSKTLRQNLPRLSCCFLFLFFLKYTRGFPIKGQVFKNYPNSNQINNQKNLVFPPIE